MSGSGGTYERCRPPRADDVRRGAAKAEGKWPAVIVESIARYYGLQALEPSVRGFLAILEKQFDRADAYVWELLQNGVDDGATQVVVERLQKDAASASATTGGASRRWTSSASRR